MSEKNTTIRKSIQETMIRRKGQTCRTYELKVDISHLSNDKKNILRLLFLEAKWFHNHVLALNSMFNQDYRLNTVKVKLPNKSFEDRPIKHLSSQMKQEIIDRVKDNIIGLSKLKSSGMKIGKLKFKSHFNSIPLKQYGTTYRIIDRKTIRIQNMGKVKVHGLEQIPEDAEVANATLIQRNGDYYVHVTAYIPKIEKETPSRAIAIDFGIKNQMTLSNGIAIREGVPLTDDIRKLHHELSRRKRYGKNWFKTLNKLNREYSHISNQRKDSRNKIVHYLTANYETIKWQDDNVRGWMKMWGRRIQSSAIGGIMSALKQKAHTPIVIPRSVPTTQLCSRCGRRQRMELSDRVFRCDGCGLTIDRDYNSSLNILNHLPAERREYTPMDTKASADAMMELNSIPEVSASLVVEIGSFTALA